MGTAIGVFFNRVDHPFEECGWPPLLLHRARLRQMLRNSTPRCRMPHPCLWREPGSRRSDGLENLSIDCQSSEPRAAQRAPPQPAFALTVFSTHRAPRVGLERTAIKIEPRKREP